MQDVTIRWFNSGRSSLEMDIQSGILVKTLSGSIVKTEKQEEPGYWSCNDGRIYLAAAFREITDSEREIYAALHHEDDLQA
jgi:hypothetical protein